MTFGIGAPSSVSAIPTRLLVELRGISKHFGEGETRVDALRDVTLSVAAGEVVGLLGPSGSGKSTLLNAIGCIVEPNEGWMRLDGEVVYDKYGGDGAGAGCGWRKSASSSRLTTCCLPRQHR